ncbi:right-handed parallel beta-helix repeat-containing protein, partial [candidate division KSB1 bacterium]|nr:right-handed parallel beta-helix repeat-containing protein [candidate division KSB1 bacterium]
MKKRKIKTAFIVLILLLNLSNLSAVQINDADYLVISHPQLEEQTWKNKLVSILEGRGFSVGWLQVEEETFTSTRIKNNIINAYNNSTPLRFVLLIGNGMNLLPISTDPPVYLRRGVPNSFVDYANGNFIPYCYEIMETWSFDNTPVPTDDPYISGLSSRGPIAIGRIPAMTSQEVSVYVNKLEDYYNDILQYSDWRNRVLFASGDVDHPSNECIGWKVSAMTDTIDQVVSDNITKVRLNKSEIDPDNFYESEACWAAFEDAINDGVFLINVFATGADQSNLGLFYHNNSSFNFNNQNKYPLLIGESCNIGEVMNPIEGRQDCVIKNLLFFPDGGIIASISPTIESSQWACREFSKDLHELLFSENYVYYGDLLRETKVIYESHMPSSRFWHGKSHVLFGDPSMPLALYQYVSGNITQNTEWSGSIIVENDISVASGVTLTIQPGTGIFFKDNAQLKVYGTLIAEGTESYPIVFSGASENPSMGDWDGIRFEDSSVDANCILKYCEIEYADYGVYISSASPTISNNIIHDNFCGIFLGGGAAQIESNDISDNNMGITGEYTFASFNDNMIRYNTSSGVCVGFGGAPIFYNNSIINNGLNGAYFHFYCDPKFGSTSGLAKGNNVIALNDENGIEAYYYCNPFIGSSDFYNNRIGGYNSFYDNTAYNAYADSEVHIEAEYNWWDNIYKFYVYNGSSIDYTPFLPSDPGGGSSLSKSVLLTISSNGSNPDYESVGFNPKKPNPNRLSDLWLWGYDLFINEKHEEAIKVYQMLIEKFPETEEARKALVKISHLFREINRKDFENYLDIIINNRGTSNSLKQTAFDLLAITYYGEKDYTKGILTCETMMGKYPDTESEKMALYLLTMSYKNGSEHLENARIYLDVLKYKYPNDWLTLLAQVGMGEKVDLSLAKRGYFPK